MNHRATKYRKSWNRRYGGVRIGVCVWLVLCQFPLPVVHAHPDDAGGEQSLAAHLDRHHRAETHDTGQWHWHLMMPWELEAEQRDSHDMSSFQPPVIWNPRTEFTLRFDRLVEWQLESVVTSFRFETVSVIPGVVDRLLAGRYHCFLSTYDSVTPVALLCVAQC